MCSFRLFFTCPERSGALVSMPARCYNLADALRMIYGGWDEYDIDERRDAVKEALPMLKGRLFDMCRDRPIGEGNFKIPVLLRNVRVDMEADVFSPDKKKGEDGKEKPICHDIHKAFEPIRFETRNPILLSGEGEYHMLEFVGVYVI